MNKMTEKIVSTVMSISLIASAFSILTYRARADEEVELQSISTPLSKLSVDFLGVGETPAPIAESKSGASFTSDDLLPDNKFWVGVAVKDVKHHELFNKGAYSVELAFEYNTDFVSPYDWEDLIEGANLKTGTAQNDPEWWNIDQYRIICETDTDLYDLKDREELSLLDSRKSKWRMCTVCISFKPDASGARRFEGLDTDPDPQDKYYLARLPFQLNNVPESSAENQNPIVLSLVRGAETFDIGSGAKGKEREASWEADKTDTTDETNLKNYFDNTFKDILLFGEEAGITGIKVSKANLAEGETPVDYILSKTTDLNKEGFDPTHMTYYVSVPNTTEKVKLTFTTSSPPTSTLNGTSVSVSAGAQSGEFVTDEISLKEPDLTTNNGYNDVVNVVTSSGTYVVHIRRTKQAEIKLNYGNSPYGEIMRQDTWSEAKKEEVKTAFKNNNYKFSRNVKLDDGVTIAIPDGLDGIWYTDSAWRENESSNVAPTEAENMDLDPYALFIYQGEEFVDPGIKAYDSNGELISNPNIIMEMTVKNMGRANTTSMRDSSVTDLLVTNDPSRDTTTTISFEELKDKYIRPDIYTLSYTVKDPVTDTWTDPVERNVIMLWEFGDSNMSAGFNDSDSSYVTQIVKRIVKPLGGDANTPSATVTGITRSIYYYRIIDVNNSNGINDSDASTITQAVKRIITKKRFYKKIS